MIEKGKSYVKHLQFERKILGKKATNFHTHINYKKKSPLSASKKKNFIFHSH